MSKHRARSASPSRSRRSGLGGLDDRRMERPGRGGGGYDDDDDYAEYDGRPRRFQRRTGGRFGGYDDHDDYSRSRSTMPGRSGNSFVDRVRRAFRIIFRRVAG